MSTSREHFSSRIGFILAAAGSAVGIGNLVGFPVNAAKNGGGAFLILYALFVFLICLPVMIAEMAVGRKTAKEPVGAYKSLSNNSSLWGAAGFLGVLTPFMIAVFYMVITVWIFGYIVMTISGNLDYLASGNGFGEFINSPYLFAAMAAVVAIVNFILVAGVKDGIERAAKILMPTLFFMLIMMVIFVLTLDNAIAGIKFFLIPDISKITPSVVNGALSQAFFSLSLGMGILITYGSYIDNKTNIPNSAKLVAITDTGVAFVAGLMILPAVFSFNPNVNPSELSDSSVSLIFTFLPKIFLALQTSIGYVGASSVAAFFFLLVFFAAITSLVSIIEVPVSYLVTEKNNSRKKALSILLMTAGVLTVFATVSFGMVTFFTEFTSYAGGTKSFFDIVYDVFYDTILPLNGFLLCVFVSYRWKAKNLSEHLSIGNDTYIGSWVEKYINFSLGTFIPAIVLIIFINTVAQKFFSVSLFGF
ncbi:sodium-dependent transporter [Colwellia sp. 4_MG-2023]|uniref:sodium-dependent transporter n=1 Tax=unclassified Colwellia TaxID=196834 RepID=UPI001C0903B3|nr:MULTISPECIES: sodium-dependent transporter [unclassified Colwellia]MBU2925029.1 sodium-dependent transporter [Colwellia sp. C2M11]MDO6486434.1 sodium-dependent transporter [Colwellia sp. 6_MG-2023]MDO6506312.1 sodium-dependent transporter [Colwellia sp. 5_MG-2023]MDO6555136.1 sodium-dependent transporter [Colwellia sp. 4_MG-2023]MDO6651678.1 sodium-dependent transporter [Colwellia sp. 3_MG-2023]